MAGRPWPSTPKCWCAWAAERMASLKGAFLRQADYTRKTQELAEHRRAAEAERHALSEERRAFRGAAGGAMHEVQLFVGLLAAVVLGAVFLVEAHRMWGRAKSSDVLSEINPMRLFHASNLYLSLLFVAVALDPLLGR